MVLGHHNQVVDNATLRENAHSSILTWNNNENWAEMMPCDPGVILCFIQTLTSWANRSAGRPSPSCTHHRCAPAAFYICIPVPPSPCAKTRPLNLSLEVRLYVFIYLFIYFPLIHYIFNLLLSSAAAFGVKDYRGQIVNAGGLDLQRERRGFNFAWWCSVLTFSRASFRLGMGCSSGRGSGKRGHIISDLALRPISSSGNSKG